MHIKQDALNFAKELARLYFQQRNTDALLKYMEPYISWIGTGEDELCHNFSEAEVALNREYTEYSGEFDVEEIQIEAVPLSDAYCIVYGKVNALPHDCSLEKEKVRFTILFKKMDDNMRIVHVHFSHGDWMQEIDHFFIPKHKKKENKDLKQALNARIAQLENLTQNMPGGVQQCKNNPELTLLSMSDSFLSMLGYSREEIKTQFNDSFTNLVWPEDRAGMLETIRQQLEIGPNIEIEYRLKRKDDSPIWILDKGRLLEDGNGEKCFYCLLMDNTERKLQQEELRLLLERHQVIMNQTTDIIFEWDIQKDTLLFSTNWNKKFGYDPIQGEISGRIPLSKNIHKDDISAFVKIMKDTAEGVPYSETEFRIKNIEQKYLWCRIRATAQFDINGRPIKAVGVIADIDSEKKQKQALMEQAQRDALTGLYNKSTITTLIEEQMQDKGVGGNQALMIIDIDYFKSVNDTYGHWCGDSLISDVAAVLKKNIRFTDWAGRIGGDEFLIYLPEVVNGEAAKKKAERILSNLHVLIPCKGASPITCSIGIAVFPRGSIDYYALYKCADQALYYQKNNGRKGVTCYNPTLFCGKIPGGTSESAVGEEISSEDENAVNEQLAQYVYRTLYQAHDLESTLTRLLEIIGRSYDVDRVYIYERTADENVCNLTFSWKSEIEENTIAEHELPAEVQYSDCVKLFDSTGHFYYNYKEKPLSQHYQNVQSVLHSAIYDEGKFKGYVGYDDCNKDRGWDNGKIATLKLTGNVLGTFLTLLRLKQRLKELT